MKRISVVALVAAFVLAGCGGDGLDDDGQEACDQLVSVREHPDDVEAKVGGLLAAGKAAAKSSTKAISDTVGEPVEGLEDFPTVDQDKLEAACEDAGVDIPDA